MKMQIEIEKIARSPSRTGRELQRYKLDRRLVVGCIPYRYNNRCCSSVVDQLEVLLISSQKSEKMMFPKGGWESDETMEEAVQREAIEEAGVTGQVEDVLGEWSYKSKSQDKMHDGYMFPLCVDEQLDDWPEKDLRKRKWVKVEEAKRLCPLWMNQALDSLIERLELKRSSDMEDSSSLSSSSTSLSSNDFLEVSSSLSSLSSSSSSSPTATACSYEANENHHHHHHHHHHHRRHHHLALQSAA